jgi:uncharacterized protein (DUF305 family)
MKKPILFVVAAGAVSFIGGAFHKLHRCHCKSGWMIDHVVNHMDRKLHLTSAQKEIVRDAATVLFNEHKALKDQKQGLAKSFSELFLQESFKSDSVVESIEQKLVAPGLLQVEKALETVHKTLSPEQRREFIRQMEKHHGHGCCNYN